MAVKLQSEIPSFGMSNVNQSNQSGNNATVSANGSNFSSVMSKTVSASAKSQVSSTQNQNGKTLQSSTKSANAVTTTDKTSNRVSDSQKNAKAQTDNKTNIKQTTDKADTQKVVSDDQVSQLVEDVKEKIEDVLDISKEDLENAMAALGLTVQDLLQPSALTQLVVQLSGNQDNTSLITDQNLLDDVKSIISYVQDQLNDLSQTTGIPVEEIMNQMSEPTETAQQPQAATDETQTIVPQHEENKLTATEQNGTVVNDQTETKPVEEDTTSQMKDVIQSKLTVNDQTQSGQNTGDASGGHSNADTHASSQTKETFHDVTTNMAQTVQQTFETYMTGTETQVDAVNIVRQIVDAVKLTATKELQSIEIQLNPENLGKVNMTVSARNGLITAQITAENEQVKKAIESQISTLREDFEQQGIKVDAVEVTVRGHEFESNQNLQGGDQNQGRQGKRTHRHLNLESLNDLSDDDLTEEELRVKNLAVNQNSSVEYSA